MKKNISIIFALSIIISSFTSCGSNYESSYSKMNTKESSMSFEDIVSQLDNHQKI